MANRKAYSVSQVNQYIKRIFSQETVLSVIFVKGEVSNCKYHSSGHIYFTLKDKSSQMACVMFAGSRGGLSFRMEDGQEVIVGGSISVYERDGKYQLYAKQITLAGDGQLYERYEALKKKLHEEGLFDEECKLPIPSYVKRVGIVTAQTGAAIQDIINIATRRNPYVQLILYPAQVQGEGAKESIVQGILTLEQQNVDVMIIGRGGGSIEDLWAFNEEIVARAIFECAVPVISAVGHETDVTIADYVADLRAPTPSAAAELAVYDVNQVMEELQTIKLRMYNRMHRKIEEDRYRMKQMESRIRYMSPDNQMVQKRQYLMDMEERLEHSMMNVLHRKKHEFLVLAEKCNALSPIHRLRSGFAYVEDESGNMIASVKKVEAGDRLTMTMADGKVTARVESKEPERRI